ncbi:SPFH domain-containing protein [Allonocardiopsis opalescens]|uniref:SPFH domain-containing protein n=1 Tax=Allonocardiopsis opalescens TaxID=1144618 RepID=A0A2T0Q0B8_9ACTN|nr:SPFH domain-containing protein [Allonocardiopsis opalescens]PRX97241.1 SPFH domain-containing protein [Allonocardiopsis opalescens]
MFFWEIVGVVIAVLAVAFVVRTVRIVPQARAGIVERLGRYSRTLEPGLNFVIPIVDRVHRPLIDMREQVYSSRPQPVITEDNLVVNIDTVLYYQVTDPRAATYEVASYLQAIDQLTVTTLRNVIGGMDLERTLTSRDEINNRLRGVLDEATGKWGIRVNRVEIKAIDPPPSIKEAMEKQMRAERDKRAAILTAEGSRASKILTAEGEKASAILTAEGEKQAAILRADGESQAIERVFQSIHANDADPKLLAYQYLRTLPALAEGENTTFFVIPGEFTSAVQAVSKAFTGDTAESDERVARLSAAYQEEQRRRREAGQLGRGPGQLPAGTSDAAAEAAEAVEVAKAEAAAAAQGRTGGGAAPAEPQMPAGAQQPPDEPAGDGRGPAR